MSVKKCHIIWRYLTIFLVDKQVSDNGFIFDLFYSLHYPELINWGLQEHEASLLIRMQYEAQNASFQSSYHDLHYSIITLDGINVGRFIVNKEQHIWSIVDISILPDYQNRNMGTRIITDFMNLAKQNEMDIQLYVNINNQAVFLYERLGFLVVSSDGVYKKMMYINSEK